MKIYDENQFVPKNSLGLESDILDKAKKILIEM